MSARGSMHAVSAIIVAMGLDPREPGSFDWIAPRRVDPFHRSKTADHRGPRSFLRGQMSVDEDKPDLGLGGHGVAHLGDTEDGGRVLLDTFRADLQAKLIAGNHGPAELDPVHRCEHRHPPGTV